MMKPLFNANIFAKLLAACVTFAPLALHADEHMGSPMGPPPLHDGREMHDGHEMHDFHGGPRGTMDEFMPPWLHGVDLDEAQLDQLFELFIRNAPQVRTAMKAAQKTERALHELAFAEKFAESHAQRLALEESQARATLDSEIARVDHAMFEVLTPAQRTALRKEMDAHGKHPLPPLPLPTHG